MRSYRFSVSRFSNVVRNNFDSAVSFDSIESERKELGDTQSTLNPLAESFFANSPDPAPTSSIESTLSGMFLNMRSLCLD